jgi:hypothetical protein
VRSGWRGGEAAGEALGGAEVDLRNVTGVAVNPGAFDDVVVIEG